MHLPRAELECAGDHYDNTHRDRNNSRQRRPLHFDLGQRRAYWENNDSEHSPDVAGSGVSCFGSSATIAL